MNRFCQPVRQLLVIVGRDGYARALCEGMTGDALPRMPIDSRQGADLSAPRRAIAGFAASLREAVQRAQHRFAEPDAIPSDLSLSGCSGDCAKT